MRFDRFPIATTSPLFNSRRWFFASAAVAVFAVVRTPQVRVFGYGTARRSAYAGLDYRFGGAR